MYTRDKNVLRVECDLNELWSIGVSTGRQAGQKECERRGVQAQDRRDPNHVMEGIQDNTIDLYPLRLAFVSLGTR